MQAVALSHKVVLLPFGTERQHAGIKECQDFARLVADKLGGAVVLDRSYTNGSRFVFTIPMGV